VSELVVVILAGGASTRLGRDKRLACLGTHTCYQITANAAQELGAPVFAAVSGLGPLPSVTGLACVFDRNTGAGPAQHLADWLAAWRCDILLLAADHPLVSPHQLSQLLTAAQDHPNVDAVVTASPDGWEPLCALYRPACLDWLTPALSEGPSLQRLLRSLPEAKRHVVTADDPWINLNGPSDLARARAGF